MIPERQRAGDSRGRTRFPHSPAAEPSPARGGGGGGGGGGGLLSEIRTAISDEPFADHYSIIPGKELGR